MIKMDVKIYDATNKEKGSVKLPEQFTESVRPDLIKRAVVAIHSNTRQAYGAAPEAGKRHVSWVSKRRRDYKGTYGSGQSRTPRKVLSRSGTRFNFEGAMAPQTVGGRRAHPPKASKIWDRKVNRTERRKAIRSALAATMQKALVVERGHAVPSTYPFVLDSSFESIAKSKDFVSALTALGFSDELDRVSTKTIRSGKGKSRGRKYKKTRGILVVTSSACDLTKAVRSIAGVEIISAKRLNAEVLAPGTVAGRATLFTQQAIDVLSKDKLFC